MTNLSTKFVI